MKAAAIMAAETDQAIDSMARDLVRAERLNGVWYVHLPMLYPDGSFVTVRIHQAEGGLRVSDAGFAYREADRVEASRSFALTAKSVAEATGVSVGDRSLFVSTPVDELERAVIDVAGASWRVAHKICERVWDDDGDELPTSLRDRLTRLFGPDKLEETVKIKGGSTSEWKVSAVVHFPDHSAVFQAVRDNANSINKASTAFRDLSDLRNPPRLVAVVQSKKALGTRLPLLSPARVLEESQPDDLFRKAAA